MAYVYTYTRLDKNEIFYVGIGSDSKYRRAKNKFIRSDYFKKIINKSQYRLDIVFDGLTWEEACLKEIELIALHGRKDLKTGTLVNFTNGGEGRLGSQNRITPTYQIDLEGNILKEWINIETICKELNIHRQALYAALNGKVFTCKKFIWCYKEKYNSAYIEDIVCKISKNKQRLKNGIAKESGKIYQYDLSGNFIQEFNSVKEASLKTCTRYSCISACINNLNKRKIANNFIWKKQKIVG
jgi:hypothetical protein